MNEVKSVEVEITVVLGRAVMPIHQLLRMGRGAVIELATESNEEVFILANNTPIARGDIVINDDKISVVITDTIDKYISGTQAA